MSEAQTIRLLVVEDEPDLLEAMVSFLRLEGFAADGVGDTAGADAWLVEHDADVLVLDLGLPDRDGLAWLSDMKGLGDRGVIVATARGKLDQRLAGIGAGADAYLIKPLELEELAAVARNVAGRIFEKRRAEATAREKGRFIAAVSHEIRNPLSAVVGAAELLADAPQDQRAQLLEDLKGSGRLLRAIADDVLDAARLDAGQMKLEPRSMAVDEAVRQAVQLMEPAAVAKGLALRCMIRDSLPPLWCDRTRLQQVVMNLVSNAIKYTERGEVRVEVTTAGIDDRQHLVRISVTDTGPGLSAEEVARLFKPFTRLDHHGGARQEGSGLGLVIAGQLVEAMGGRIEVRSTPGEGSRFRCTLPLPIAAAADASRRTLAILLVDDDAENAVRAEAQLVQAGHHVTLVRSGPAALGALKRRAFDLVVMAMEMPGMSGLEVTRRLRGNADANRCSTPIVLLSAGISADAREAGRAAGADEVIARPLAMEELRSRTAAWFRVAPESAAPPRPLWRRVLERFARLSRRR